MCAIMFDLDIDTLQRVYENLSYKEVCSNIATELKRYGFLKAFNNLYYGSDSANVVKAVLAVQSLSKKYDWFSLIIKDIRWMAIKENVSLKEAIYFVS